MSEVKRSVAQGPVHYFSCRRLMVKVLAPPEDQAGSVGVEDPSFELRDQPIEFLVAGVDAVDQSVDDLDQALTLGHGYTIASGVPSLHASAAPRASQRRLAARRNWLNRIVVNWAELSDAYGSGQAVPELLAAAELSADFGPAWDEVWGRLCHQGTVYSASYAAIPLLADICSRQPARGFIPALQLAGSIIASTDGPESPTDVRERYRADIRRLRDVAVAALPLAESDTEFIYGLETLAAFEDLGTWQRTLKYLANGEAPILCPHCGDDLLLQIDDLQPRLASWDGSQRPQTVTPSEPGRPSPEHRLLELAAVHGRDDVETKLRYFYGVSRCPACGGRLRIRESFA